MFIARLVLLLVLLAPASAPAQVAHTGSIEGSVVDRDTRRPVHGAVVVIEGTALHIATAADGRFVLGNVPAGIQALRVEAAGYVPASLAELRVSPARAVAVVVELTIADGLHERVLVEAPATAPPPAVTSSHHGVAAEEIRRSAGSLGDVNRLVQALPGLAVVGDLRNDLVTRGGSPSENLILVDGIEVPTISHFSTSGTTGGVVSMINSELIADAGFFAGAFPAAYGNRLSSVLDIHLRDGNRSRTELEVDVNFAGAAAVGEGPIGGRGSWIAAARRSFFDMFARSAGGDVADSLPRMSAFTGKVAMEPGGRDRFWLIGVGGSDAIHLAGDAENLDEPDLLTIDNRAWRVTAGGGWQRLFGKAAFGVLTLSESRSHYHVDVRNGALAGALQFRDRSNEGETTVKYDLSWQPAAAVIVTGGASWKRLSRDLVVAQPIGVSMPFSIEPPDGTPGVDRTIEASATIRSGYGDLTLRAHPRLRLTAGARLDSYTPLRDLRLSPRAGAEWRVSPRFAVSAGAGRFHQHPDLTAVTSRVDNAALAPMASDHAVAGAAFEPHRGLRVTVEAYRKRYHAYPVSVDYPAMTLANAGAGFEIEHLLLRLASHGRGRIHGLEFLLKQQWTSRFYGQAAYTLSRTEHAALDGVLRRGAFDTPHVLSLLGGHRFGPWTASGRFTFASGAPYTPPLLPASADQNRWIHDLDRVNAERLDAFHRLDVRIDRAFRWRRGLITAFVDVQNLYDRRGVIGYEWNEKTRAPHRVTQLGVLPVLGVNVEM